MGIVLVKRATWEGMDINGNPLLSNSARKGITHDGKYFIELIEE